MQNASRRGFLWLLAAVPVLGPAIAKEAMAAPRGVSGLSGVSAYVIDGSITATGGMAWGKTQRGYDQRDYDWVDAAIRAPKLHVESLGAPDSNTKSRGALDATLFGVTPPSTPNRLYGATINDDGDAT